MIKNIDNILFDLRDSYPTDEIVVKEIWEEDVYRIKDILLNHNSSVLDIGANIGAFSIYVANQGASVFAIEPEPNNYEALINNIKINNMEDLVFPVKLGISDYEGTAIIDDAGGGSTIVDGRPGAEIKIVSLNKFVKDNNIDNIDILKIDTEGSELPTILGASKETLNICKYITIEFDIRTGSSLGEMVKKLSETHHVNTMGSWERGGMIFADRY